MSWRRKPESRVELGTVHDSVIGEEVPAVLPVDPSTREITSFILRHVAAEYNVPIHSILGNRRSQSVVAPRHAAVYLIYSWTNLSLVSIGKIFNRDHSTIHSTLDKMDAAMERRDMGQINKMAAVESLLLEKYRKPKE